MPSFKTNRQVPFTATQMFDLVADIKAYPEFLPMCRGMRIRDEKIIDRTQHLTADMIVGYKSIREMFTSRVALHHDASEIVVEYVDGPFRYLHNVWRFRDHADGCDVRFEIDYEFKSVMLAMLVGALFDKAFRHFTHAFESRAHEIYGASGELKAEPLPTV